MQQHYIPSVVEFGSRADDGVVLYLLCWRGHCRENAGNKKEYIVDEVWKTSPVFRNSVDHVCVSSCTNFALCL